MTNTQRLGALVATRAVGPMHLTRRTFVLSAPAVASATGVSAAAPPAWRTGRLAVPGGEVLWRMFGGGPGLPFIMVHGGPTRLGSKLLEYDYPLGDERRLITWDQLDTGGSDKPRNPKNWRLARFVEELERVRQALAPGPVHVGGASTGSGIVMEWMITHRPRDVKSLVLMCPTLDMRVPVARQAAQQRLSPASAAAFREFNRTGRSTPEVEAAQAEYRRIFIMRRPPPGIDLADNDMYDMEIIRALTPDLAGRDRAKPLRDLTQPVLFVRGEHDWVRDEDVRAYAALCRDAEIATIPDAAHLAFIDNPTAYHAVVRRFFRKVEGRAGSAR